MFINQTNIVEFDIFERRYNDILFKEYPYLREYRIICCTQDQYKKLEGAPFLDCSEIDSFCFSFNDETKDCVGSPFVAIIVCEEICYKLGFTQEEMFAAIAHEVGHITNANTFLKNAHVSWQEIFADKIATDLGLSEPLISLIEKLKNSHLYTEEQISLFNMRIKKIEINS